MQLRQRSGYCTLDTDPGITPHVHPMSYVSVDTVGPYTLRAQSKGGSRIAVGTATRFGPSAARAHAVYKGDTTALITALITSVGGTRAITR